ASWFGQTEDAIARWIGGFGRQWAFVRDGWRWAGERRGRLGLAAGAVAIVAYLATGLVAVAPDEVAALRRCGRFLDLLEPGLHVCLPWPWDSVTRERAYRVLSIDVGMRQAAIGPFTDPDEPKSAVAPSGAIASRSATEPTSAIEWNTPHDRARQTPLESEATVLTGDQSIVELGMTVQCRIDDLGQWLFGIREPEQTLRALAESTLREVIATHPVVSHDDGSKPAQHSREILTAGRAEIEIQIAERLQERIDDLELGVIVLDGGVCLQDVHPPLDVVPAFRDVSSAFKEKGRMLNEADADYRQKVITAAGKVAWRQLSADGDEVTDAWWSRLGNDLAGEAAAELRSAEAFAIGRENAAAGDASRFAQVQQAEAISPHATQWRLVIDAVSAALKGKKKLIFDSTGQGRRHLLLSVPQTLSPSVSALLNSLSAPQVDREE
ncbi:MAG TPA: protease modulator HflK, partial [Pirellulales bacterium]|nr:protease modulator HflK [Pirellulales bacterium]